MTDRKKTIATGLVSLPSLSFTEPDTDIWHRNGIAGRCLTREMAVSGGISWFIAEWDVSDAPAEDRRPSFSLLRRIGDGEADWVGFPHGDIEKLKEAAVRDYERLVAALGLTPEPEPEDLPEP